MGKIFLTVFLLGIWSGGTVFMWMVAIKNFQIVEAILETPTESFQGVASMFPVETLRLLMRYQASEVNRLFFESWGIIQIGISAMVARLTWQWGRRLYFATAIILLAICLVLQFYVVPEVIRLGRIIDFISRQSDLPDVTLFWRFHHIYTSLDIVKLLGGRKIPECPKSIFKKNMLSKK